MFRHCLVTYLATCHSFVAPRPPLVLRVPAACCSSRGSDGRRCGRVLLLAGVPCLGRARHRRHAFWLRWQRRPERRIRCAGGMRPAPAQRPALRHGPRGRRHGDCKAAFYWHYRSVGRIGAVKVFHAGSAWCAVKPIQFLEVSCLSAPTHTVIIV